MIDVFTEETEVLIKEGICNLYWFKKDLAKAWLRAGVAQTLCNKLFNIQLNGQPLSKRQLMDELYLELRKATYERRLEISRNFVRILIEHKTFTPQDKKHRIEIAERSALKLKDIIRQQEKESYKKDIRVAQNSKQNNYFELLDGLNSRFKGVSKLPPQQRGYALEKIFTELMKISNIPVEEPFKIDGEQIDGAIKYEGHYYLIELKWLSGKVSQKDIASLYMKVEGKLEARGIFIAMEGYSQETLSSLPKGKELKVLLLDGFHFVSVLSGVYTFRELMEFALSQASLKGNIYCSATIS